MAKRHTVTVDTLGHWRFDGVTGADEPDDSGNGWTAVDKHGSIPSVIAGGFLMRDATVVNFGQPAFETADIGTAWDGLNGLTISSLFYLPVKLNDMSVWWSQLCRVRNGTLYYAMLNLSKFSGSGGQETAEVGSHVQTTGADGGAESNYALEAGLHLATASYNGSTGEVELMVDGAVVGLKTGLGPLTDIPSGLIEHGGSDHNGINIVYMGDTIVEEVPRSLDWHTAHWLGGNPIIIAEDGGYEVTVEGTFPAGVPLDVFLGPNGDATDSPCYGGQSRGYNPVSEDGTTLTVFSPPIAVGEERVLSWRQAGTGDPSFIKEVNVLERSYGNTIHRTRRSFPPWTGVGPRRIELEP